jgi:predicted nucleic acid-binding protein
MNAVFADTFYWVALSDFSDSAHQRALALTSERARSRIVTTDEVLTESSMQTMRRERITDVLTSDRHFEQEGFRVVFREA